jgi:hypothetical protein
VLFFRGALFAGFNAEMRWHHNDTILVADDISPGKITTPPHPTGCCTPTGMIAMGPGGAAGSAQKIGNPMVRKSLTSRMPPSATTPAAPASMKRAVSPSPMPPTCRQPCMSMTMI